MNKDSKQANGMMVDKAFTAMETGTSEDDGCTGLVIDYPEVFVNENFEYNAASPGIKEKALVDGLAGWDLFLSGHIPRKQFGNSMIKIETLLGANASQVNLTKIANRYKEFGLDNLREVAYQEYEKNPGNPFNIEMTYDDMSKMVAKKIKATL